MNTKVQKVKSRSLESMLNCLLISSLATETMRSEMQELTNLLSKAGYTVKLLQATVNSLELYRSLHNGKINLVWLVCHSNGEGFVFAEEVITPTELGLFLHQAKASELVLNSCFSAEHAITIQRYANCSIIATITATIEDKRAWISALYLGSKLAEGRTLRKAFGESLQAGNTEYRWFPKPDRGGDMADEDRKRETSNLENSINRLEATVNALTRNVDNLSRAVQGDAMLLSKGLIERTISLEDRMAKIETRLETRTAVSIDRRTFIIIVLLFLFITTGIIYLTYVLGGYDLPLRSIPVKGVTWLFLPLLYSMRP